jgi:hypothetical protein
MQGRSVRTQRGDAGPDPSYYDVTDGNGQATTAREAGDDVGGDARPAADCWASIYARLNQILDQHDFDGYVEKLCQRFYADEIGRPGLAPGRYFRFLLIGYFEGLDAERAIRGGRLTPLRYASFSDWCCRRRRLTIRRSPGRGA